jgi:uncharacterized FlaG/YvyC family protein
MPEGKMTYEQVSPISSIDIDRQVEQAVQLQTAPQSKPAAQPKQAEPRVEEKKTQEAKSSPIMTADVQLKFIVDGKSNNITVLVVDRANQRVIRAIPPEELNQFKEGDLLSLFV